MTVPIDWMFLEGSCSVFVRSEGLPWLPAGGSKYCELSIVFPVKEISGSMVMWERFKEVLAYFPPTHMDPLWPHFYTSLSLWGRMTLFRAFERYENILSCCRWENLASESEASSQRKWLFLKVSDCCVHRCRRERDASCCPWKPNLNVILFYCTLSQR